MNQKCGTFWSNKSITREQKTHWILYQHCARYHKTFGELKIQILSESKENLPKWVRVEFLKMVGY
jgi:hypothetical protein